jgi:orotidine-5'-phosphate decarboxylase
VSPPTDPKSSPPGTADSPSSRLPAQQIAVALDTGDRDQFRSWCRWFGPRVGVLKVGLEAFVQWGPPAVEEARRHGGALFLDLKLHDIPNTVAGAVRSARNLGVRYLTVHASGGPAMLEAAVEAAHGEVDILAVTVLTHLDEPALAALEMAGSPRQRVLSWAALARRAGCAGVVCSPLEAAALRAENPTPFLLVTPGIRPASTERGDQRRTATPREALAAGANLLVVGRPLTQAADPESALEALLR